MARGEVRSCTCRELVLDPAGLEQDLGAGPGAGPGAGSGAGPGAGSGAGSGAGGLVSGAARSINGGVKKPGLLAH